MDALADLLRPNLEDPWIQSVGIFILSLVLTVVARWSLRFVLLGLARRTRTEVDDILIRAVKNVATYSIPVLGLMMALTPLAPLLGALGIGGLAVALALNSSLSNIFSGIQLIVQGAAVICIGSYGRFSEA